MHDAPEHVPPEGDVDDETHGYADYTAAELLEQAQANYQATVMATALFVHQKGIPVAEWAAFIGRHFAMAWNDTQAWEAGEFMDAMLTNLRALGAEVVSTDLGIDRATAVTTGFPDPDLCEFFSIDAALVIHFSEAAKVVAAKCGLNWAWKRSRTRVTYTVTRLDS
jgi:hypothetical protein